jgi:1-acyl-sn-glycerol-3-phosphate acyltransferase
MTAPVTGCGAGCLPRGGPRVAGPVRVARVAGVVATVAAGVPLALLMPVLTGRGRTRAVRGWFRVLLRATGVRLVVRDAPGARVSGASAQRLGALVVANHISWLDICAVLALEPMRVLAKSEVRRWPVVGLLADRAGTLFIERARLRRLPVTVAEIAAALRAGQSVLVFPEGTTWCGRTRGRLYPATFQAAIDADAAVRPLSLRYRLADGRPTTVAAFLGADTLPASLWRVTATRGLVVEVEPAPALPAGGATRRGLAAATAAAWAGQPVVGGSTQCHAPGRTVQVRRRTGPEMSPSAFT